MNEKDSKKQGTIYHTLTQQCFLFLFLFLFSSLVFSSTLRSIIFFPFFL